MRHRSPVTLTAMDSTPTAAQGAPLARRRMRQVNREPAPRVFRGLAHIVHAFVPLVARRRWSGQERLPSSGGVIVVANHISNADPLLLGEFLIWSGRWPHFLGKSEIWNVPGLGWLARACEQIPVYRNTRRASESLVHAEEALAEGMLVAIYPEGTITGDPDGWPMTGRRGAAHLALVSGAPVVPVAQTGADLILGGKRISVGRLIARLLGRRADVSLLMGEPIDLSAFAGREPTKEVLDEVTDVIIETLTLMRAELLGVTPPEGRYDPRAGARVAIGKRASE